MSGRWKMYVLRCKDDSLYTGVTTDLRRRIREHQLGKGAKYTRSRLPVEIVYFEPHPDRSSAQKAESAFKKLKKAEKERRVEASSCKPVNKDFFAAGDLVRVLDQVHDPEMSENRTGIIVEMVVNTDRGWSDVGYVLFDNKSILKFHVCHLEKIALD